jgi:hypothetical protein
MTKIPWWLAEMECRCERFRNYARVCGAWCEDFGRAGARVPMFELFKLFNSKISNSNRRRSGGWFWNPISMIPGFRGNRVSHDDAKRGTYTEFLALINKYIWTMYSTYTLCIRHLALTRGMHACARAIDELQSPFPCVPARTGSL